MSCNPKVGFVYDQFAMDETVATELDLVCQDQFKVVPTFKHAGHDLSDSFSLYLPRWHLWAAFT